MCPECGRPLVERKDSRGRKFAACSGFPTCRYIQQEKQEVEEVAVKPCPKCGGDLIRKKGKYGYFLGCRNYPTCGYMERIVKKRRK